MSYQKSNPNFAYSTVDMMSIANVHDKSKRYVFEMWLNVVFSSSLWKFVASELQMKAHIHNLVVEFIEGHRKNDKSFPRRAGFGLTY